MTLRALVSTSHSPSRRRAASPSSRARTASRAASPCAPGPSAAVTSASETKARSRKRSSTKRRLMRSSIDQPPRPGGIDVGGPEPRLEDGMATRPVGGGRPRLGPLVGRRLEAEPRRLPGEEPSIHVTLDIRRLDGSRRRIQLEEPERARNRDVARRHEGAIDLGHHPVEEADLGLAHRGGAERAEDGEEAQRRSGELPGRPGTRSAPPAPVAGRHFVAAIGRLRIRRGTPPSDRAGADPRPGSAGGRRPRRTGWARPGSRRADPPRPPT